MKKKSVFALFLIFAMLVSGCSGRTGKDTAENESEQSEVSSDRASAEIFSDRDFEVGYDEGESVVIQLNGDSASCSSDAVQISGSTVTIKKEGTYILSGTLNDGMIMINAEKTDKIQLILNGVTIHSETCAPIYILQSDKVFITMAEGTDNTLSNGGTFTAIDDNHIDAVIFSKEDITLNGSGTMTVTSPAGHGIVSKDSLTITSGIYNMNCASHGFAGKDDVSIANAEFTIVSGKDGIHAENADDGSSGFVHIQSGTFEITAEGDGISASAYVQIEDGSFHITSGGGSTNAESRTSDSWGSFRGGGRSQGGKGAGEGGMSLENADKGQIYDDMTDEAASEDDGTSMKGIKAIMNLVINGGTFSINSADDSIHSNASVTVNGGTFDIAAGDDAFHADDTLAIAAGTIHITESYEGLEGLHVDVSGGEIALVSSDDGLNAAGGTDASGSTGGRDGMFGRGGLSSSNGTITISGGTLHVTASGDGIDANGTISITGGYTVVSGPAQGDTATLDYDASGTISGGTFIGTGASGMAQSFSSSEQGVIAVKTGTQSDGTAITLTDRDGNTVITYTPDLPYEVVILSSPDIITGETYTLTTGSSSVEFTAG